MKYCIVGKKTWGLFIRRRRWSLGSPTRPDFRDRPWGKQAGAGERTLTISLATCYTKILYPMFAIPKTKEKENPYARSGNQSILRLCLH